MDDDLEQMWFKASLDAKKLEVLPPGALEKIIFDAMVRLRSIFRQSYHREVRTIMSTNTGGGCNFLVRGLILGIK